jgi:hypothetical protein
MIAAKEKQVCKKKDRKIRFTWPLHSIIFDMHLELILHHLSWSISQILFCFLKWKWHPVQQHILYETRMVSLLNINTTMEKEKSYMGNHILSSREKQSWKFSSIIWLAVPYTEARNKISFSKKRRQLQNMILPAYNKTDIMSSVTMRQSLQTLENGSRCQQSNVKTRE